MFCMCMGLLCDHDDLKCKLRGCGWYLFSPSRFGGSSLVSTNMMRSYHPLQGFAHGRLCDWKGCVCVLVRNSNSIRCCTDRAFRAVQYDVYDVRWIVCKSVSKGGSSCAYINSHWVPPLSTEVSTTGAGGWGVRPTSGRDWKFRMEMLQSSTRSWSPILKNFEFLNIVSSGFVCWVRSWPATPPTMKVSVKSVKSVKHARQYKVPSSITF